MVGLAQDADKKHITNATEPISVHPNNIKESSEPLRHEQQILWDIKQKSIENEHIKKISYQIQKNFL